MGKRKKLKTNIEAPPLAICIYCKGEKPGVQGICSKCFREFLDKTKEG